MSIDEHHSISTYSAIGAIVLAAGGSSRMGRTKQLLKYKGETLLRRACVAAIAARCQPVVVVLGCGAEELEKELGDLPVEVVINRNWQRGIGSSIRVGVERTLAISPAMEAVAILLCDQPLIDVTAIGRLIETYRQSGKGVCAAAFAGTLGPPVMAGRQFFATLLNLPDDRGAKEIWLANPDALCTFACEEAGMDIDTPADCARLGSVFER
jgi:molybdenum cofactor cytidylyltransferase